MTAFPPAGIAIPSVKEAVARIREFEARISQPTDFYARHRAEWPALAQRVTLETLLHLQPHDADTVAPAVPFRHFLIHCDPVRRRERRGRPFRRTGLQQGDRVPRPALRPGQSEPGGKTDVTFDDIRRWVEEDRAGVEGARQLKASDSGLTDLQIAWRVFGAIRHQKENWERPLGHVCDFKGASHTKAADALSDELLKVWQDVLVPAIVADWPRWVAAHVAALG